MSEPVKRCGAYIQRDGWPVLGGCTRPGTGEGGLCKAHAAGRKRSAAATAAFETKYYADKAEDERRRKAFHSFIATLDKQALRGDLLALYADVREHLRMQMASRRDYVIGPLDREETK